MDWHYYKKFNIYSHATYTVRVCVACMFCNPTLLHLQLSIYWSDVCKLGFGKNQLLEQRA